MGAGAGLGALEVVSRSGSPMWLVRGHIGLSLVGPELESGTQVREVVSY